MGKTKEIAESIDRLFVWFSEDAVKLKDIAERLARLEARTTRLENLQCPQGLVVCQPLTIACCKTCKARADKVTG